MCVRPGLRGETLNAGRPAQLLIPAPSPAPAPRVPSHGPSRTCASFSGRRAVKGSQLREGRVGRARPGAVRTCLVADLRLLRSEGSWWLHGGSASEIPGQPAKLGLPHLLPAALASVRGKL